MERAFIDMDLLVDFGGLLDILAEIAACGDCCEHHRCEAWDTVAAHAHHDGDRSAPGLF